MTADQQARRELVTSPATIAGSMLTFEKMRAIGVLVDVIEGRRSGDEWEFNLATAWRRRLEALEALAVLIRHWS